MIIGNGLQRTAVEGVGAGLCCRTCEPVGSDRSRSMGATSKRSSEPFPCDGENVSRPASFDFLLISYASEYVKGPFIMIHARGLGSRARVRSRVAILGLRRGESVSRLRTLAC